MSKMISVASGFQYSVNIAYDLHDDTKIENFIPTQAFLSLLDDVLESMNDKSNDRARVLVGAYGKGKSHIILTILSLLMRKDIHVFDNIMPVIKTDHDLYQKLMNYYDSKKKILPVVITGSNTSISQAFLLALKRTLDENDLKEIMPETNYKAAVSVIERWKTDYTETYNSFVELLEEPIDQYLDRLSDFDSTAYEKFEKIYPLLTAGSTFNPFLGFDVVELYGSVIKELKKHGYSGIYVIYDEFSKYLEANITKASISDTKMLQDFAEKCNRSGNEQMHVMLISHKEISNYIDTLPKQKVDGWRGVSERFKHIHLNNDFSQTYEVIASVIKHEPSMWDSFCNKYKNNFETLYRTYHKHHIFKNLNESQLNNVIYDCYPLHPISTFILPRLSEKVAQNERTLFTFLSAKGISTLPSFLENYADDKFTSITPDVIFDYFEPLFKKEVYTSLLHSTYILTSTILLKLEEGSLESKIVKTVALIYLLEQFDILAPTPSELMNVYSIDYTSDEIDQAISRLINEEFVVYQKQSNHFLKLKKTSGININEKIHDMMEKLSRKISVKDVLNQSNVDKYIYPTRYNDEVEMTRYFKVEFIDASEVTADVDWNLKTKNIKADGVIYAIIPNKDISLNALDEILIKTNSETNPRYLFVTLNSYEDIQKSAIKYEAVRTLKENALGDEILYEEYSIIYDDLDEMINNYISSFLRPEKHKANYIYNGHVENIARRSSLTGLLSRICKSTFTHTPIINNEALNKDVLTSNTIKSREKIVSALLRSELEYNLGFSGHGQEVSVMRGVLINTEILSQNDETKVTYLNEELEGNMKLALHKIEESIKESRNGELCFSYIYDALTNPNHGFGIRKGVMPILLAAVFHKYKSQLIISENFAQVPLNAKTLEKINADPSIYFLDYLDWNEEKEGYVTELSKVFKDNIIDLEKSINNYDYVAKAMKRWYLNLPKYVKENKINTNGDKVDKIIIKFNKLLRRVNSTSELLFVEIPELFGNIGYNISVVEKISEIKYLEDNTLNKLEHGLLDYMKDLFALNGDKEIINQMTLSSIMKDWLENLAPNIHEVLFGDGTERFIKLIVESGNDELSLVKQAARLATGLRTEDWSDNTFEKFTQTINKFKSTAESYKQEVVEENTSEDIDGYQISYLDDSGKTITKRFDKIDQSRRGKLLYNAITANIDSMGQAISDQEKRQILMTVLEKFL